MTMSSKVLSLLEACFDLVPSPSMKIQLMGGKITENFGSSRRGFVCSLNQPPKGRFLQAKQVHISMSSDFQQLNTFLEIFTENKVQVFKVKFT